MNQKEIELELAMLQAAGMVAANAKVIEIAICELANYDVDQALTGFERLATDMKNNIRKRCDKK